MESTLILEYLEGSWRRQALMPAAGKRDWKRCGSRDSRSPPATRAWTLLYSASGARRRIPRALYERSLGQALAAYPELEDAVGSAQPAAGRGPNAADVATAVAWRFGQFYNAELVPA